MIQTRDIVTILKQAAANRSPNEKIIVVVDSLEDPGRPGGAPNLLGLPARLPDGVFFIVSKRPGPDAFHTNPTPRCDILLSPDLPENLRDIDDFLTQAATRPGIAQSLRESGLTIAQFITILKAKSQGKWLYLHYVLYEIEHGHRTTRDFNRLPNGLLDYYIKYWEQWIIADNTQWHGVYLPILATLAAVKEPVGAHHLNSWTGLATTLIEQHLEQNWPHFIAKSRHGQHTYYQFFHATLRELFEHAVDLQQQYSQYTQLLSIFKTAYREAYKRILQSLCNDLASPSDESMRRDAAFRLIRMDWLRHRNRIAPADIERQLEAIGRYVDTNDQRQYLIQSIDVALGMSADERQRARLLVYRAALNGQCGETDQAEADYYAAERLILHAGQLPPPVPEDQHILARIYLGLANIHSIRAEPADEAAPADEQEVQAALRYFEQAASAANAFGRDPQLQITIQKELIYTYALLAQWQLGEDTYRETIGFLQRIQSQLEPTVYARLQAQLLEVASQLYYKWALSVAAQSHDLAHDLLERARALAEDGINLLNAAFDRTGDQELVYDRVLAYINKGDYLQAIGEHLGGAFAARSAEARTCWEQAREQAQAYDFLDMVDLTNSRLTHS